MAAWHELEGELELEDELEQALSPLYEWNELSAGTVQFNPFVICAGRPFRVLDAFRFDSSKLRHDRARDHLADIKAIASQIILSQRSARPVTLVCVNGHTDPVGSDAYNERLGQRRANAVAKALSDMLKKHDPGLLSRVKIVPQSLGEAQPIPGGAEKNRRVEVFL